MPSVLGLTLGSPSRLSFPWISCHPPPPVGPSSCLKTGMLGYDAQVHPHFWELGPCCRVSWPSGTPAQDFLGWVYFRLTISGWFPLQNKSLFRLAHVQLPDLEGLQGILRGNVFEKKIKALYCDTPK